MRILFALLLLGSNCLHAQKDSAHTIRVDYVMPFTAGFTHQATKGSSDLAEHLINNSKPVAGYYEWTGMQVHYRNKLFAEADFISNGIGFKRKEALAQLQEANPDHFIQEESEYQSSSGTTYSSYGLHYWRLGLGADIRVKHFQYLQPHVLFCSGKARLPSGQYAFKEYTSNMFYIKDYKLPKRKCTGLSVGLAWKWYSESDEPSKTLGFYGLTAELTYLSTRGKGTLTSADPFKNETVSEINYEKSYTIISLGIIVGLASK